MRDWSIIVRTVSLSHTVDRLRRMLRRDGSGEDLVVTTRKHKEVWKKFEGRWLGYEIEELEGELFINGIKYAR